MFPSTIQGMHRLQGRSRAALEAMALMGRGSSKGEAGSLPTVAAGSRPAHEGTGAWLSLPNGIAGALIQGLSSILLMLQGFTSKSSDGCDT